MNSGGYIGGRSVFAAAVEWLQATLLGSLATVIAVIAVTIFGFLLLSGRIHTRRAVELISGCFIIFGAHSLASGFVSSLQNSRGVFDGPPTPPPAYEVAAPPGSTHVVYDPYAGAAMPIVRQ